MLRSILTILSILLYFSAFAQQRTISGTVTDEAGVPLPNVVVRVVDAKGSIISHTSTDQKGKYVLQFKSDANATSVKASFLGYAPESYAISPKTTVQDFALARKEFKLPEFTLKADPIRRKGDTLSYSVSAFKNASDRTIEDVIRKLPGVEVEEGGRIKYNGKSINKFYIEGLDLLGGRYSLATQNISADDISTINVYERHQPKEVLKDIVVSDDAALNLKLKKGRMLKPVGKIEGGAGIDGDKDALWLASLFSMLISPENQTLITAKGNNAGEKYEAEMQDHIGGSSDDISIVSSLFTHQGFGSVSLPFSRYKDNTSVAASANTLFKLTKKTDMRVIADYTFDRESSMTEKQAHYAEVEGSAAYYSESAESSEQRQRVRVAMNVEKNLKNIYLNDKLGFRASFVSNTYDINNTGNIMQRVICREFEVNNNLSMTLRRGNNLLSAASTISFSSTPRNSMKAFYTPEGIPIVTQTVPGKNFYTYESIAGSKKLARRFYLQFSGFFDANCNWIDTDLTLPDESTYTDNNYSRLRAGISPSLQFVNAPQTINLTLSIPLTYNYFHFSNHSDPDFSKSKFVAAGSFSANFRLTNSLSSRWSVTRRTNLGGMNDFLTEPIFISFRDISILGSGFLDQTDSWNYKGGFTYFDIRNAFNASLTGSFSQISRNNITASEIGADDIIAGKVNTESKGHQANIFYSIAKTVYPWHTSFKLSGSSMFMRSSSLRQGNLLTTDMNNHFLQADITTAPFSNVLTFGIGASFNFSNQRIKPSEITNSTKSITGEFKVSVFPIDDMEIYCNTQLMHNTMIDGNTKTDVFVDGGARMKFGKWAFELQLRNLTNRKTYEYSFFSGLDSYTSRCRLRPIEALLTATYSF